MSGERTVLLRLSEATLVALPLTALAWLPGRVLGQEASVLELAAVWTSFACTYLCVVQSRLNYPLGAVSCALYALLFWRSALPASAAINVWLVAQLVYGWLRWGPDEDTRPVRHVELGWVPMYLIFTLIFWTGAVLTAGALGGSLAGWDSAVLALSLLAQFLLDNKRIETWAVWVAVNVIAIGVYAHQELWAVVVQYVLFLGNTGVGWWAWRRTMTQQRLAFGRQA